VKAVENFVWSWEVLGKSVIAYEDRYYYLNKGNYFLIHLLLNFSFDKSPFLSYLAYPYLGPSHRCYSYIPFLHPNHPLRLSHS